MVKKSSINIKEIFCNVHGLEIKSLEENLSIGGFIATTHLDDGWFDSEHDVTVRDKIAKEKEDC